MNDVAFPGHINVMVLAGVKSGVVRIQTSGDICVGRFTSEIFLYLQQNIVWLYLLGSLHTEQKYMMVDLLMAERV